MIMITAIVTIMVTAIISSVARYVEWHISVLGDPLYKYIIWHLLLLSIAGFIFYDSRHGFKWSIEILGNIAQRYHNTTHRDKVNLTMTGYREHARKFKLRTILLPVAITLFVAYILSAQLLFFAIVTSGSMEPTFKKGDLVFMQDIFAKPGVGDVIIFQDPKGTIVGNKPVTFTHRVFEISGDKIRTKGDNNPFPDSWYISRNKILGKAIIISNKPLVLKDVGKYFLLDYRNTQYTEEFLAISRTIQNMRTMGIMIFFVCLILYLFLSIRDARHLRHFRNR